MGRAVLDRFEIIVVDDASTDGSGEILEGLKAEFPELVVAHHARNRRLGGALKTGFSLAGCQHVLYIDSDLPIDLLELKDGLPTLDLAENELLVGYRIGRAEGVKRAVVSRIYNLMIRGLFGLRVRDVNFAFKLIPLHILQNVDVRSEGSFIDAEILLESLRQGAILRERGFVYHPRVAGVSTLGGFSVVPQILRDLWHYRRCRWRREAPGRRVIFNADDFGLDPLTNAGVVQAVESGVVRSVSLMTTGDAFPQAAEYCRRHPALDAGVHLALCEVKPACLPQDVPSLVGPDGRLAPSHREFLLRYVTGRISAREVQRELRAQVQRAVDAGVRITHLDSHQHIHALPGIRRVVESLACDYGVPAVRWPSDAHRWPMHAGVRGLRRSAESAALWGVLEVSEIMRIRKLWSPDNFVGMTDAGRWSEETLCDSLRRLPKGVTEVACHPCLPAEGGQLPWQDEDELRTLSGEGVLRTLRSEGISVTTFSEECGSSGAALS